MKNNALPFYFILIAGLALNAGCNALFYDAEEDTAGGDADFTPPRAAGPATSGT